MAAVFGLAFGGVGLALILLGMRNMPRPPARSKALVKKSLPVLNGESSALRGHKNAKLFLNKYKEG